MNDSDLWKQLLDTDLVGGTLVEYKDGCGFTQEWGRGTITEKKLDDGVSILTDGLPYLSYTALAISSHPVEVDLRKGVYYLDVTYLVCYAVAPAGVTIPPPEGIYS